MPIRKSERHKYPANWKEIRERILKRAYNCCEGSPLFPDCRARNYSIHPDTGGAVVLTVAHMDHNAENSGDDNLRALCQRCHLAHDKDQHRENAKRTREEKLGIMDLFGGEQDA